MKILILIFATLFYQTLTAAPAIIAHRGLSGMAPEETRASFMLAQALGADYLEFDLHRTKDGVLIAIHDSNFYRTTDIQNVFPNRAKDEISTFTFDEVQKLDAGSWYSQVFVGEKVLTLKDIIELAKNTNIGLYIETKDPEKYPGIEKQIVDQLNASGVLKSKRSVIYQSKSLDSLAEFKKLDPTSKRVYLVNNKGPGNFDVVLKSENIADGIGPHYVRLWQDVFNKIVPGQILINSLVAQAHRHGMFVHTWTIDSGLFMSVNNIAGADGVFTNRADRALVKQGRLSSKEATRICDRVLSEIWKR